METEVGHRQRRRPIVEVEDVYEERKRTDFDVDIVRNDEEDNRKRRKKHSRKRKDSHRKSSKKSGK